MSVNELITALQALSPEQRELQAVVVTDWGREPVVEVRTREDRGTQVVVIDY